MIPRSNHAPLGRGESSNARELTPEMKKALSAIEKRSATWLPVLELALYASLEVAKMQQALADLAELGMVETDDQGCWRFVYVLSEAEASRFTELETAIARGLKAFYDVGIALLEIRDRQLYKAEFSTFDAYCEQRWEMSRSKVDRTIKAAQVVHHLALAPAETNNSEIGWTDFHANWRRNVSKGSEAQAVLPQNEAQVRPLTRLSQERQRQAWELALRTAPNGKITAKHVEKAVEQVTQSNQTAIADNSPQFPPKVGDIVQIQFRDSRAQEPSLRQHHRQIGIVQEANELTIAARVWGGTVIDLFVDEVRPAPVNFQVIVPTEVLGEMLEAGYPSAWHAIAQIWDRAKE